MLTKQKRGRVSVTLDCGETEAWESNEQDRRGMRQAIDSDATESGGIHVEVYSHDGVTLDAWKCVPGEWYGWDT